MTQVEFVMPTLKKFHYIRYKSLQTITHTSFVFVIANKKKMAQFQFQALALILLIFRIEGKRKHMLNAYLMYEPRVEEMSNIITLKVRT